MAHYALLDENNIVVGVITGRDENEIIDDISNWEEHYSQITGFNVKRTSYNTYCNEHLNNGVPFRKNYAIIGGVYDEERDAFYAQQPYPSWILNEQTFQWDSPIPYPDDNKGYNWNETSQEWVEITQ
jgi:hypothetical protein